MPKNYRLEKLSAIGRLLSMITYSEIQSNNIVVVHKLVDFTKTNEFRKKHQVSYTAVYAKAIANVVVKYPSANRRIIPFPFYKIFPITQNFINVDVAVGAAREEKGLENVAFIDIVRDADTSDLQTIHKKIYDMRTSNEHNNKQFKELLKGSKIPYFIAKLVLKLHVLLPKKWVKYRGGSILLSSPGKFGMDTITTSWTAPLGFSYGYIEKRPMVVNDEVVPRLSCNLILSFDRRLLAGREAGLVFSEIVELMENPEKLLEN